MNKQALIAEMEYYFQDLIARQLACEMIDKGISVPIDRVQVYGGFCRGLQDVYKELYPIIIKQSRGEDKVYRQAEYELCMSSAKSCYDFHVGTFKVGYKDFERDKKGRLLRCKAYFFKDTTIRTEINQ